MTTTARPISYYLAPALLGLGIVLAAGDWYFQRERAAAWAAAIVTLFLLAGVWGGMTSVLRRSKHDAAGWRGASVSTTSAVAFAGLMMVIPLGVKLAVTLGALDSADVAPHATMVVLGAFFAFTGNALPKMLTPLSAMQCDGSRRQAFQRFAGWTWTLTGLAFAIVWLVLPAGVAKPLSLVFLMSGMLIVAAQVIRLRWTQHRAA
jgi:hypothetical protein